MAYADLSPQAKEGLVFYSNLHNLADGKEALDYFGELQGRAQYEIKMDIRRAKRIATLEKTANAALAAQVDALA